MFNGLNIYFFIAFVYTLQYVSKMFTTRVGVCAFGCRNVHVYLLDAVERASMMSAQTRSKRLHVQKMCSVSNVSNISRKRYKTPCPM